MDTRVFEGMVTLEAGRRDIAITGVNLNDSWQLTGDNRRSGSEDRRKILMAAGTRPVVIVIVEAGSWIVATEVAAIKSGYRRSCDV